MIQAIIFDCFGVFYADPVLTLTNDPHTSPETASALHALDKQAADGNISKADFIKAAATLLDWPYNEIDRYFFHSTKRNQSLINFTQHARAKYKVALLSNIGGDMMDGFFTAKEQAALFDVVILSGNIKISKPDPRVFEYTLAKLNLTAKEVVFIDDRRENVEAAKSIGMQGILFYTNRQLRGDLVSFSLDKFLINTLQ